MRLQFAVVAQCGRKVGNIRECRQLAHDSLGFAVGALEPCGRSHEFALIELGAVRVTADDGIETRKHHANLGCRVDGRIHEFGGRGHCRHCDLAHLVGGLVGVGRVVRSLIHRAGLQGRKRREVTDHTISVFVLEPAYLAVSLAAENVLRRENAVVVAFKDRLVRAAHAREHLLSTLEHDAIRSDLCAAVPDRAGEPIRCDQVPPLQEPTAKLFRFRLHARHRARWNDVDRVRPRCSRVGRAL